MRAGLIFAFLTVFIGSCTAPKTKEEPLILPVEAETESPEEIIEIEVPPVTSLNPLDFAFVPDTLPSFNAVPGVGVITRESRDRASSLNNEERAGLTKAFIDAYIDSLLRDQSLEGVLGVDQVHGWPLINPISWTQNWQTAEPMANSWGLPSLVLAIMDRETKETEQNRVFTVHGGILDFYGRSHGINGANGNAGYGSPRGEQFLYDNKLAQRFDHGLIIIDENGAGSFIEELAPSRLIELPPLTGVFSGFVDGNDIQMAFISAWNVAMDSGMAEGIPILYPDGNGFYISLVGDANRWNIIPGNETNGLYVQTFNQRTFALVLPDVHILPSHARFLGPPFLELLTARLHIPGAEGISPLTITPGNSSNISSVLPGNEEFIRRLLAGFSLYGIPLSDPVYRKDTDGVQWIKTQRFSRGWIIANNKY